MIHSGNSNGIEFVKETGHIFSQIIRRKIHCSTFVHQADYSDLNQLNLGTSRNIWIDALTGLLQCNCSPSVHTNSIRQVGKQLSMKELASSKTSNHGLKVTKSTAEATAGVTNWSWVENGPELNTMRSNLLLFLSNSMVERSAVKIGSLWMRNMFPVFVSISWYPLCSRLGAFFSFFLIKCSSIVIRECGSHLGPTTSGVDEWIES